MNIKPQAKKSTQHGTATHQASLDVLRGQLGDGDARADLPQAVRQRSELMSAERNHTHLTEQVTTLGSAERSLRSASPPVRFVQPPYKLNAIGKPYSANYSPNYRMNHRPSYGHLRAPYPTTMRFVGDPPNYDPNLRCFRGDQWWTQLQTQRRKQQPKSEENAAATLSWKENARKAEFTKRAPSGGRYILSPFLHCWNVDYCEKKSKKRQQLGFACTLDEAKAIAEADNKNRTRS